MRGCVGVSFHNAKEQPNGATWIIIFHLARPRRVPWVLATLGDRCSKLINCQSQNNSINFISPASSAEFPNATVKIIVVCVGNSNEFWDQNNMEMHFSKTRARPKRSGHWSAPHIKWRLSFPQRPRWLCMKRTSMAVKWSALRKLFEHSKNTWY